MPSAACAGNAPRALPYSEVMTRLFIRQTLSLVHDDLHLSTGTKGQIMQRIRLNSLPWNEGKRYALSECSDQQLSLHQSKVVANADTGTSSEGNVGVAWNLSLAF